jgi:putative redox protein
MKVELARINQKVHFQAKNEDGNTIEIDGAPSIGGENQGFRPMQLVLAAVASCSLMDLVTILEKSRQHVVDIQVSVEGTRADMIPAVFTGIHLHYKLKGKLEKEKVERALDLAVKKYCSVGAMLEKTAKIDYTYEILS